MPADVRAAGVLRRCRVCGCTDTDCARCVEETGGRCFWVAFDLCSGCDITDLHAHLRAWAKGSYCLEAATELLIRGFGGRFALPGNAWITRPAEVSGAGSGWTDRNDYWVDFAALPDRIGALSGGERRYLSIAASIGHQHRVNLATALDFDRDLLALVLAAISHTAGPQYPDPFLYRRHDDEVLELYRNPDRAPIAPLFPWPSDAL